MQLETECKLETQQRTTKANCEHAHTHFVFVTFEYSFVVIKNEKAKLNSCRMFTFRVLSEAECKLEVHAAVYIHMCAGVWSHDPKNV